MDELRPGDPRTVGRYALSGRLGAGGMGQVFLGSSPGGRPVAVKLVHPGFAADATGHTLRLLLGLCIGLFTLSALIGNTETLDEGGPLIILGLFALLSIWLVRVPALWLFPLIKALVKPSELYVGASGLELRYGGRRLHYGWHEIARVVVQRVENTGWSVCVFPLAGMPLPPSRGARTPLGFLDRKTGWIVVVPVHRIKGSRKEIEMTIARYAGPRWGGNG